MRNKILLIEDDPGLAISLKDYFEDNGLEVFHTAMGEDGLALYAEKKPDLIVLDIILPDANGFDVLAQIRDIDLKTPIILMTGTEFASDNQIKGYQLGAINFMPKPIIPQALLALIQNILSLPQKLKQYEVGGHRIRIHSQAVEIDGKQYNVRERDSILLEFLLERMDQIVSRSTLLKQIWFDDHPDMNNLLDGAVLRLRRLFKSYPNIHIKTIYGNGYMLSSS